VATLLLKRKAVGDKLQRERARPGRASSSTPSVATLATVGPSGASVENRSPSAMRFDKYDPIRNDLRQDSVRRNLLELVGQAHPKLDIGDARRLAIRRSPQTDLID